MRRSPPRATSPDGPGGLLPRGHDPFRYGTFLGAIPLPHMYAVDASQEGAFGVGRIGPPARYDLTQTSPVTSELRSLVDDLRVREVSYVLSPMYNVNVGAVDSSTPLVTPLLCSQRVVNLGAHSTLLDPTRPLIGVSVAPRACPLSL